MELFDNIRLPTVLIIITEVSELLLSLAFEVMALFVKGLSAILTLLSFDTGIVYCFIWDFLSIDYGISWLSTAHPCRYLCFVNLQRISDWLIVVISIIAIITTIITIVIIACILGSEFQVPEF